MDLLSQLHQSIPSWQTFRLPVVCNTQWCRNQGKNGSRPLKKKKKKNAEAARMWTPLIVRMEFAPETWTSFSLANDTTSATNHPTTAYYCAGGKWCLAWRVASYKSSSRIVINCSPWLNDLFIYLLTSPNNTWRAGHRWRQQWVRIILLRF